MEVSQRRPGSRCDIYYIIIILFLLFVGNENGHCLKMLSKLGNDEIKEETENVTTMIPNQPSIKTIILWGVVGQEDTEFVNSTVEYVYQYSINTTSFSQGEGEIFDEDIRVHATITNYYDIEEPVVFVVRQQKAVVSFLLPMKSNFDKKVYNIASRTLCDEQEGPTEKTIFTTISTSSKENVSFSIIVSLEQNFIIRLNESTTTDVSPLSPKFFRFVFPNSQEMNRFILLEVTSDDDRCLTVSVQNSSCPILDQENNVEFEGSWQTMTRKAGMTLRKDDFPNGFYLVFVMHGDNSRCNKVDTDNEEIENTSWSAIMSWFEGDIPIMKNVTFIVTEKISYLEYVSAILGTVAIFLIFYIFSFIVSCAYLCKKDPSNIFPIGEEDEHEPGPSSAVQGRIPTTTINDDTSPILDPSEDAIEPAQHAHNGRNIRNELVRSPLSNKHHEGDEDSDDDGQHWLADSDSSLDEEDYDILDDAMRDKNIYRTSAVLCVAALSKKNPRVLAKKSQLYLWTLLTVAIFYGLPVVQLVFTYQNVLHTTGNQDLCYYNYLCAHPLWILSDFNHVYSNIGYIMLGVLFLLLVARRERIHENNVCKYPNIELTTGIPRHFGLFYSMGVALIMEGVLSAAYHVCPNHSNFQFDTCFMYVNAMLLMLKIYQTRHPDINASAYMAFTALAVVVLLGVVGVLDGNLYFWVFFTAAHLIVIFFLSFQIYYLGRWRFNCGVFKRVYNTWKNDCLASPLLCLRPYYMDRFCLLLIVNIANIAIAWFGVYNMSPDFASHLLIIFMANLFLYSNFYIIMKLTHKETITFQPLLYIVLFWTLSALSIYAFSHRSTSWQKTPAESRTFNRECILLNFYDFHDVWHGLSAASIFFSFMILLTLDDDLTFTPRTKIPVF